MRARLLDWNAEATPPSLDPSPWITPHEGFHGDLKTYLLGLLCIGLGELEAAESHQAQLARASADSAEILASDLGGRAERSERTRQARGVAHLLAQSIRAMSLRSEGRFEEALTCFEETGHVMPLELGLMHSSPLLSQALERYVRAEILYELGRHEEAYRWYETAGFHSLYDVIFLAPSYLRRAEIHERRGESQEALGHYRRFVTLWQECDPELRDRVDSARRSIARLEAAL
jgi:tetratricopeptide (TPR) repeat protein